MRGAAGLPLRNGKSFRKITTVLFLQLFHDLFFELYKAEACWKGLVISRTFLLTGTWSTIAACPRFSDTKDFGEEHWEHLKTSLHFVFSHTLPVFWFALPQRQSKCKNVWPFRSRASSAKTSGLSLCSINTFMSFRAFSFKPNPKSPSQTSLSLHCTQLPL